MASIQASVGDALTYLPAALDEPFPGHPIAEVLVRDLPEAMSEVIDDPGYKVQGSRGRGRWAETVWVAAFDRLVTETAQRGYYLVYLFRRDGDGVYLSLNQGTTAVHQEVGGRRYLSVLRDRATVYAGLLRSEGLDGLEVGTIDLGGGGTLTRGYEAANIVGRFYDTDEVPQADELQADLRRFLALYQRLVEANDHLADADAPAGEAEASPDDQAERGPEARLLRWHLRAERNPKLVAEAKRIHGSTCAVCGFNYGARYGELGVGYIEAHHLTPVSELRGRPKELDPRHDFAAVCANCHRIMHRRQPPYSIDEIRGSLLD